jgi:ADP-L-glycero-D-manno-heptose 6-epimerase
MIVVTGAAGLIGSVFIWELNRKGITDILCVDNLGSDSRWRNLLKRKFTNIVSVEGFLEYLKSSEAKSKIKTIVHMGANSSTLEVNVDSLMRNNYEYTKTLFEWCTENKKEFIYASSAATYGNGEKGYDDTTDPNELKPLAPYGYSKVIFDRWALQQKNVPPKWIGIKFFNVFGPNEYHKGPMTSVAFKAFHEINNTGKLKLFKSHNPQYADGKQMRDFVYVKDCTKWMLELMTLKVPSGIYNMGSGQARTWLDLAESAFKTLALPIKIDWVPVPENMVKHYQYFTEAKMNRLKELGISEPEWPLERAVADYYTTYLANEDQYL